jgi:hypothetical protein
MSSDSSPPDGPPPDEPPTGTPPADDQGSAERSSDAPPPEEPAAAPPPAEEPAAAASPPEEPVAAAPPPEEVPDAAPEQPAAAAPPPEEVPPPAPPPAGDEVTTEAPASEAAPSAPPPDADVTAEAPLTAGALASGVPPPAEELRGEAAPRARGTGPLRLLAYAVVLGGLILMAAGAFTWYVVRDQLEDEKITVSEDADRFAGDPVENPWTAYEQADVINEHALEASDGLTYAQLDQDDPRRDTVMTASFLRASLYTSVVSFGVAAFAFGLGLLMIIIGWALLRINRSLRAQRT